MNRLSCLLVILLVSAGAAYGQDPVSLELNGPLGVAENFHASYTAKAHYDDGSNADVTALAVWAIDDPAAGYFSGPGGLTTIEIGECSLHAVVSATYVEGDIEVSDDLPVTVLTAGGAKTALDFGGVDDIAQIPDDDTLDFGKQATVELWLRMDAGVTSAWVVIKGDGQHGASDRAFDISVDSGGKLTVAFYPGPIGSPKYLILAAAVPIPPNQWVHVATTIDTEVPIMQLFVDGDLVAERSTFADGSEIPPVDIRNSSYPVMIGCNLGHPTTFAGMIDEFRMWNFRRMQGEIRAIMYRQPQGNELGLMGYWRFDEGAGQAVVDLSPFGNHGYLGIDPSAPDEADPLWVSSDAPLGPSLWLADLNCDGSVNGFDIDPFVTVIGGRLADYYIQYPECNHCLADINEDGLLNGFDIDPFIELIGG